MECLEVIGNFSRGCLRIAIASTDASFHSADKIIEVAAPVSGYLRAAEYFFELRPEFGRYSMRSGQGWGLRKPLQFLERMIHALFGKLPGANAELSSVGPNHSKHPKSRR